MFAILFSNLMLVKISNNPKQHLICNLTKDLLFTFNLNLEAERLVLGFHVDTNILEKPFGATELLWSKMFICQNFGKYLKNSSGS